MNILVLGGTQFVGRHIVDALARAGHSVTRFHRGHTNAPAPLNTADALGDRNTGLGSVAATTWDVIVDVNGYEPHQVERSLALETHRYIFISTCSVYADLSKPGIREDAPVIASVGEDAGPAEKYGGNKSACERLVLQTFPNAAILRPGIIAGPYDPTDRFTYWCERVLDGGAFLAPEPREQPVQFADARDIADFVARVADGDIHGTFNLVGPQGHLTMEAFIDSCAAVAREFGTTDAVSVWIQGQALFDAGVNPWIDLPLWLPSEEYSGLLSIDNSAAQRAGFAPRSAPETIRAVMEWTRTREDAPRKAGLTRERERELLISRF